MPDEDAILTNICDLPTEVLLYIFTYLSGRQLARSRRVCVRWKHIIDRLSRSDYLWREHCRKDFLNVYRVARRQAKRGLLWFNIYRCLTLWPQLNYARELHDEFAAASVDTEEVKNVKVLTDGTISVHKRDGIVFYDIETLQQSKRGIIRGDYLHYSENEHAIIIQNDLLHVFVIRKRLFNPNFKTNTQIDFVKLYLLVDHELYYVTFDNEVYVMKLEDENLSRELIQRSPDEVMAIGYTNQLNLLTFEKNIFSVENKKLFLKFSLECGSNLLHMLNEYNFLENIDWNIIYEWQCYWGHFIPDGPLKNIVVVKVYGDMVFVGCKWGVLRIYHKPYSEGTFDFYKCEPVKQYNFMERSDCPVLSNSCPIRQVDVLETEDGHTIFVCMPKKIAVVHLMHNFKRSASAAMLPYDVQNIKILRI